MALIVEDGSARPDANSYVSVDDADTYWGDRNNAKWQAADTPTKEAAIIEAMQWLTGTYQGVWDGRVHSIYQSLDWPRVEAYDIEDRPVFGVPRQVKAAVCELALEYIVNGRLAPSLDRGGMVAAITVGPITTEFQEGAPGGRAYPFVDTLLAPMLRRGGAAGTLNLVRC